MRLQRLDHVSLNVSDRPRSIAWYRDVLGLEQRGREHRDDWPVFMGQLGACVALFQAQTVSPQREDESTGLRHVAFAVEQTVLQERHRQPRDKTLPQEQSKRGWMGHRQADVFVQMKQTDPLPCDAWFQYKVLEHLDL